MAGKAVYLVGLVAVLMGAAGLVNASTDGGRRLLATSPASEIVTVDSAKGGQPGLVAWSSALDDFVTDGGKVVINGVSPPPPPGGSDEADFSSFLLPANLSDAPVVTVSSAGTVTPLAPSAVSTVGQAYSLTIADAVARGATATASDLIYQAILRLDTVTTTSVVLNSMVQSVGCYPPLTTALQGAAELAQTAGNSIVFSLALRNVQAPIGSLAACFAEVAEASEALAPAPGPSR